MKKYIIAVSLIFVAFPSAAQQTRRLTLNQCIDFAMKGSNDIKIAEKGVERAKIMQGTAWEMEKTELSLSQDPTSGGSPDNSISLTQAIEFPTVYAARRSQLKAEAKAEQSKAEITRRQLSADIASLYFQLAYQMENIRILQKNDSYLANYQKVASKRYETGEARQIESLSAKRMLMENRQELVAAQTDFSASQRQLAALMNIVGSIVPAEDSLVMIEWKGREYNFMQTAEGQYAQDKLQVADRGVRVAKSGYAPSLSLSLRNQLVISSWNPYHADRTKFDSGNFMGFEVGIGVPIFFGATKAKVKAAKKEREMAELEMQQTEKLRKQEYATCLDNVSRMQQKVNYYNTAGKNTADEMMRIGSIEYENGEISYLEYISIAQDFIDARMKRAAAINGYNQAVVSLMRLTGGI